MNLILNNVYDLELTSIKNNTELRKLFIETTSKSIIVIEDIDCSLDLTGKRMRTKTKKEDEGGDDKPKLPGEEEDKEKSKVTLSGLLNFIDGLRRGAAHNLHHQPRGEVGPGTDTAGEDGQAHRDVLLQLRGVHGAGQQLPGHQLAPAVRHHQGADGGGEDDVGRCGGDPDAQVREGRCRFLPRGLDSGVGNGPRSDGQGRQQQWRRRPWRVSRLMSRRRWNNLKNKD
ncbi:hypothetical protein GW17_00041285 [Ensete ventricosum]|nr:hypothetical protein GW17_00041285 [Ensete ventricosum]